MGLRALFLSSINILLSFLSPFIFRINLLVDSSFFLIIITHHYNEKISTFKGLLMYGFILFMLCISFSAPIITMESPDTPRLKRRGSTEELPPMPHAPKKLCSAQPRITNKEKVPPLTILATRAIRRESGFETHDDEIIINHGKLRKWLDKIIKTPADCTKTIFNIFCKNLNQPGDPAKERQKKIDGLHYMRNALLLKGACAAMITGLIEAEANHAHTLNRDSLR